MGNKEKTSFFNDIRNELKHITWLSKKKVERRVAVILGVATLITAMVSGLDALFQFLLGMLASVI